MKKNVLFGILFLSAGAAVAVSSVHDASAGDHCRQIHARLADAPTQDGCASPVGLCLEGDLQGSILDGSLFGTVMNIVPGATPDTLSIDAIDTFTTSHGTLTLHLTGVYDPVNGTVTFLGQSPSGTGQFEGVTGLLYVNGGAAGEGFESDISGELCFPAGAPGDE